MFTVQDASTVFTLTDAAADKVKSLIEAEGNPELVLRVAVRPGGCSGLSYEMFFDSDVAADDVTHRARRRHRGHRPRQRASTSAARRSTSRTASRAPGSRSTNPNADRAAAAAASRSPEPARSIAYGSARRHEWSSASVISFVPNAVSRRDTIVPAPSMVKSHGSLGSAHAVTVGDSARRPSGPCRCRRARR